MRLLGKLALASALATATLSMAVATPAIAKEKKEDKGSKLKNSKGFVDAYLATDALIKAGDIAGAKASAEAAVAAVENDDDRMVAGQLLLNIADRTDPKDAALAIRGFDLLIASASMPAAEKPGFAFRAGAMAYTAKDYQTAVTYMEKAKSMGYAAPEMHLIAGQARLNLNDAQGYEDMRAAVAGKAAAGEVAPEQWLRLTAGAAERSQNSTELVYWTRSIVQNYPTKENWRLALGIYEAEASIPQDMLIDLFRLRRKTGTLISEADYAGYFESMSVNGLILLPQEALDAIEEGVASGVLSRSMQFVKETSADAQTALADDKANSAAREKRAVDSKNARSILSSADVALNVGNYARAIELYDLAAAAGADANVTNMRKGIAFFEMGDSAAAKAAFGAVQGSPRADIASYWMLYVDLNSAPAAAATPAQ